MDIFTRVIPVFREIIGVKSESFGGNLMKKYSIFILVLVLTAALFTGCGCRNSKPMDTMPQTPSTTPVTTAPTRATTEATSAPTTGTDATIEDGNGPLPTNATAGPDGDTSATEGTGGASRSGGSKGGSGAGGAMGSGSGNGGMGSGAAGMGSGNGSASQNGAPRRMPR